MYLLDANVFIQAKNSHYGFEFVPGFWDWLVRENRSGVVASVERVGAELRRGRDELADWVREVDGRLFLSPDAATVRALTQVSDWASAQGYEASAVATFLQVADYWLIAHALANDGIVVTHEVGANTMRKIKIPNVCQGLGVRCINPFEMLRDEGARFVLAEQAEFRT